MTHFAKQLRENRKAAGLTQTELAEKSDTTQAWISALENGRAFPSYTMLAQLARAFGHPVLITHHDAPEGKGDCPYCGHRANAGMLHCPQCGLTPRTALELVKKHEAIDARIEAYREESDHDG